MCEIHRLEAVVSDHAKTSFVANVSHELRSPLHGILGSIEFLQDTAVDPFQASMITTVETCGKTLLDTVNHVLNFAKLSTSSQKEPLRNIDRSTVARAHPDLDMDVDLATVVEEVVEAVYAGQTFRSTGAFHGSEDGDVMSSAPQETSSTSHGAQNTISKFAGAVRLLLDIEWLDSWRVRTQPGAVRRVVMNLLGNSLKYTSQGVVCVSLQPTKSSKKRSELSFCITVSDTGKGMSIDFARNHAWEAFAQEDSFANGVGLGLSIVRQITSSLGGNVDLQSSPGKGTKLEISLAVPLSSAPYDDSRDPIKLVSSRVNGLKLCILDPGYDRVSSPDVELNKKRAEDIFRRLVTFWFAMKVFKADSVSGVEADFFIYLEPPSAKFMLQRHIGAANSHVPTIIITNNAFQSANLRRDTLKLREIGRTIDIISQPCGPQKLARAFERCIYQEPFIAPSDTANTSLAAVRIDGDAEGTAASSHDQVMQTSDSTPGPKTGPRNSTGVRSESFRSMGPPDTMIEALSVSGAGSVSGLSMNHFTPSATFEDAIDRDAPDRAIRPVLLVDDNEVNLKLLVAFVRKAKLSYQTARDGLQAVELYIAASKDPSRAFRAVVMDVQMPMMDGLSATREIRSFESKSRIHPPAIVIALTGLASSASQHEAFEAGVDHFLPKPVKFKEFLKLLEQ